MISTRDANEKVGFIQAILKPASISRGLYTFENLPYFSSGDIENFCNLSYKDLCKEIFTHLNLGLDSALLDSAFSSYENFDDKNTPTKLHKYSDNLHILELYHGPTRSFKDMALQPFSKLIRSLSDDKKYVVLVATSGDTGPATLEGFKGAKNIRVVCLYPSEGTSDVQRLQMVTIAQDNIKTLGINGDFDDAQSILKSLLQDVEFREFLATKEFDLSVANSLNIGRIVFQIIYYIHSYCKLLKDEVLKTNQKLNIIVPSGNFGNILGAFFAKRMGVPLSRLISASNANNILYEFIETGIYDINGRKLIKTISPAMDIIKSSNVERVLFELFGDKKTKAFMEALDRDGRFSLNREELEILRQDFGSSFCDDERCKKFIKEAALNGYIIDPHTACGLSAYMDVVKRGEQFLLCSTAEWSKFAPTIAGALGFSKVQGKINERECIDFLINQYALNLSPHIANIFDMPIIHNEIIELENVKNRIMEFLS